MIAQSMMTTLLTHVNISSSRVFNSTFKVLMKPSSATSQLSMTCLRLRVHRLVPTVCTLNDTTTTQKTWGYAMSEWSSNINRFQLPLNRSQ